MLFLLFAFLARSRMLLLLCAFLAVLLRAFAVLLNLFRPLGLVRIFGLVRRFRFIRRFRGIRVILLVGIFIGRLLRRLLRRPMFVSTFAY